MNTSSAPLGKEQILGMFEELSRLLDQRGCAADIFVVGGSAMALGYERQRTTRDVDAVFTESATVRTAASVIARDHGLASDWLNDAAKGFMPGPDPDGRVVFSSTSLRVEIASPEYLLAMKLMSSRPEQDLDDAVLLWNLVGYTETEEGLALLERMYGSGLLTPRHEYFADAVRTEASTAR